ncbi:glycosyltransferase family 32 protein [Treponema sp.]|uniref:glycosyltransferase family 32 protein n=1 Tax=Treponema sp. TaxID=166 RepID=UPI003F0A5280
MNDKIPKIIHYCWFGENPLPELAEKCLASWRKFFPGYEIKEWNESNYDVRKIPYIAQAYDAKKYAFVSDYARFDILYQYGGIYFDTDVEVIRSLDDIIEQGAFAGVERTGCAGSLNAGLGIASPAASPVYKEILDSYMQSSFLRKNGSMNLTTVVERVSGIFKKLGLKDSDEIQTVAGVTVYPADYFCPINPSTGELKITENTRTIHHYAATWTIPLRKKYMELRNMLAKKIGIKAAKVVLLPLQFICVIKEVGFKSTIRKLFGAKK